MPKSWRASERRHADGSVDVTTKPYSGAYQASEAELLRDHGYDPEEHMILGGWKESSWTAYKPKEYRRLTDDGDTDEDLEAFTFTAKAFKFKVVERPKGRTSTDVDELVKALDSREPMVSSVADLLAPVDALIFAIGDTQIGKLENPLEGLVQRFTDMVDSVVGGGNVAEHIHIAWLGDCIEGVNSQGGALRWRTSLTLTEQVRVLQRMMMYAIESLAPLTSRLTVSSVPGNHDEAFGRDLQTRIDDSWAVQALVGIEDAIKFSQREDLAHVECYVPGPDQQGVTLDVGGVRITQVHGHQWRRGKHYEWWEKQAFGGQDAGSADVLLNGHEHTFQLEERGPRLRVAVPAMEAESVWYTQKAGTPGNPGSLLLTVKNERISNVARIS